MITRRLAEFTSSISYSEIPSDATEMAITCFLDFLGVSLRGSGERSSRIAMKALGPGEGESTIIGHGSGAPERAALINGISAHNLDLDDGHRLARMHPGACVIPAALAAAEYMDLEFRDLITAMVAGYEATIFMGILVNPAHRMRGFHTTGTCGAIGAAAAASMVMGLDADETACALGLAATQAAGLLESDHAGTMAKHLHAGRAAQSGIISALLASEGFTGAESAIEGREGFLRAMSDGSDAGMPELGAFHIRGVYLKRYPVCRHLHPALDAAADIMAARGFMAHEIESVTVSTYDVAAEHDNYSPDTIEAVRQSLPVSLAVLLERGELSVENLQDAFDVGETASKITVRKDPLMEGCGDRRPAEVTVRLKNGEVHTCRRDLPAGEPEEPFTWEDVVEKFSRLNPGYRMEKLEILQENPSVTVRELMDGLELKQTPSDV